MRIRGQTCLRPCLNFLARVAVAENDLPRAAPLLDREIVVFGDYKPDGMPVKILLQVYAQQGRNDEAQALWKKAWEARLIEPSNPTPANRSTGVALRPTFDWSDCGVIEKYELYLWKTGEQAPSAPVAVNLRASEFRPGAALKRDTVYFWRVAAIGIDDMKHGETWFFRTGEQ